MAQLIILDCYGTITSLWGYMAPRNGLEAMLEERKDDMIVIATDGQRRDVQEYLAACGLDRYISHVYDKQDMREVDGYAGKRKDLAMICKEQGFRPQEAVFISDGLSDAQDSYRDGVPFVLLPSYIREEEEDLFSQIDIDSEEMYRAVGIDPLMSHPLINNI